MITENFTKESINEQASQNRERAYKESTDSLYFKAQRGEATIEEWENAVAEIKLKFPYTDKDLEIELPEPETDESE